MALTDTVWCGSGDAKHYVQSGQFTSTIKTSIDVLDAIKSKEGLSIAVPEKANAIDRNHVDRGIRKNHNKIFADFKVKAGVNIV